MLRAIVSRDVPAVVPLALDPLSAKMAEVAGFEALYLGGGAMGYVNLFSEANLGLHELVHVAVDIRAACQLPLILDGTCGWGDPMHLHRTIALSEAAGIAGIEIEDQLLPKRAHHHVDVEHLIPLELMVDKVKEAVAARRDSDFVIIARTNACRTDNVDVALARAEAYRRAGADMLLILPKSPEEAEVIGERIEGPLLYMTLGGVPSMGMTLVEAGQLGYKLVVDAVTPLFARQKAMRLSYEAIFNGRPDPTFGAAFAYEIQQIHDVMGLEKMLEVERRTTERSGQ